ncbi:hypothetical protein EROM_031180 [Encephalitozoon romaleae SJ-2008]|uniref:Uncharacterized protein n=1 Tax=Encephalitozoon romaleae (strain SJ-2008) TaxID=1178016 RepID=I7ADT0_ENCRO|nr:hypothetical protein EROM_031180 [Encephalitozoon romaleae SJ-2008]AFN82740.1 hypothetical protein EROM_031180 [Encephalitozoon romaleae SJ-2008]
MDSKIEFSEVDDEDVQSEVNDKLGSRTFWVLFWISMTCILIVILRLLETYFVYDVFSRTIPGSWYLLWLPKKTLYYLGAEKFLEYKYEEYMEGMPKELEMLLSVKRNFCMTFGLLILVNIASELFPISLIHALNLKFKAIDFWRPVMIGIRICILTTLLRGKNIKEITDGLSPESVNNLLAAQYCFTSAWELFKEIENNTVIEVIVRVIGYWIITTTISKETSSLIESSVLERIIRHTNIYFSKKHPETTPNSDIQKKFLDFLKSELSSKSMSYLLATILTPFFCIFMTYFLLKTTEKFEQMVYRELEISDKFIRPYIRVLTIIFIILFLLYAYHEILTVVDRLEEKVRTEKMFSNPNQKELCDLISSID